MKSVKLYFSIFLLFTLSMSVFGQNQLPNIDGIGENEIIYTGEGIQVVRSVTAVPSDAATVTGWSIPDGATFSNNVFTWTPTSAQIGPHSISFTVTDTSGTSNTVTATIQVESADFLGWLVSEDYGTLSNPMRFQYDGNPYDDLMLGPVTWFENAAVTFEVTSGVGSAVQQQDNQQNTSWFYTWTPTASQAGQPQAVSISMSVGETSKSYTFYIQAEVPDYGFDDYGTDPFYVQIGDTQPLQLYLGPDKWGETTLVYNITGAPSSGSKQTLTDDQGNNMGVYFVWTPTAADAGVTYTMTVSASGISGFEGSGTITFIAELPHFPIQNLEGQVFGAMVEGKALEVMLGPVDWNGTALQYEITSKPSVGTSSIVQTTDTQSGSGETVMAFQWKPPATIDPEQTYSTTVTMSGITEVSVTFQVQGYHHPLYYMNEQQFYVMVGGESFEYHLGSVQSGEIFEIKNNGVGQIVQFSNPDNPEWKEWKYQFTPSAAGDNTVTIEARDGELEQPLTASFTITAELPYFPIQDMNGGMFGAMVEGQAFEYGLGPATFNGTPLNYEITSEPANGTSSIVDMVDQGSGETMKAFHWKPSADIDPEQTYSVTLTMSGIPDMEITVTFQLQGGHHPLYYINTKPDTFRTLIGVSSDKNYIYLGEAEWGDSYQIATEAPGARTEVIKDPQNPDYAGQVIFTWTPTASDEGAAYQVTITATNEKYTSQEITGTFTVAGYAYKVQIEYMAGEEFGASPRNPLELYLGPVEGEGGAVNISLVSGPGEVVQAVNTYSGEQEQAWFYRWTPTADDAAGDKQTVVVGGTKVGGTQSFEVTFYVTAYEDFTVDKIFEHFPDDTMWTAAGEPIEFQLGPVKQDEITITYNLTGPGELVSMPAEWNPEELMMVYRWTPSESDIGTVQAVTISADGGEELGSGSGTVYFGVEKPFELSDIFKYMQDTIFVNVAEDYSRMISPDSINGERIVITKVSGPGSIVEDEDEEGQGRNAWYFRMQPSDSDINVPQALTVQVDGGDYGTVTHTFTVLVYKEMTFDDFMPVEGKLFEIEVDDGHYVPVGPVDFGDKTIQYTLQSGPPGGSLQAMSDEYGSFMAFVWDTQNAELNVEYTVTIMATDGERTVTRSFKVLAEPQKPEASFVMYKDRTFHASPDSPLELVMGPVSEDGVNTIAAVSEGPGSIIKKTIQFEEGSMEFWYYQWTPGSADIGADKQPVQITILEGDERIVFTFSVQGQQSLTLQHLLPVSGTVFTRPYDECILYLGPFALGNDSLSYSLVSGPSGSEIEDEEYKDINFAMFLWLAAESDIGTEQSFTVSVTNGPETAQSTFSIKARGEGPDLPADELDEQVVSGSVGDKIYYVLGPTAWEDITIHYSHTGPGTIDVIPDPENAGKNIAVYAWTPGETDAGKSHTVTITLSSPELGDSGEVSFTINVAEYVPTEFSSEFSGGTLPPYLAIDDTDESNMSLTERDGYLRIYTKYTESDFNNVSNRLSYKFPDGTQDFTVSQSITFEPSGAGQVAYTEIDFSTGKSVIIAYGTMRGELVGEEGTYLVGGRGDTGDIRAVPVSLPQPLTLTVTRSGNMVYFIAGFVADGSQSSALSLGKGAAGEPFKVVFHSMEIADLGDTDGFFITASNSTMLGATSATPVTYMDIDAINVSNTFTEPPAQRINQPPVISYPAADTVFTTYAGSEFVLTVEASDEDGDELVYNILQGPGEFADGTSEYHWRPSFDNLGENSVTIAVSDNKLAGRIVLNFTVSVGLRDVAPEITGLIPAKGYSDKSLIVRVLGNNIQPGGTVTIGVSPFDVTAFNSEITDAPSESETGVQFVKVIIPANTFEPGTYDIKVTNPNRKFDISEDYTLTLISSTTDIVKPVFVSGPSDVGVTDNSATITWKSDEPTRGTLYYGTSEAGTAEASVDSVVDDVLASEHFIDVDGLEASTTYYYRVVMYDSVWNGPTASRMLSFTTDAEKDTIPPVIVEGPFTTGITMTNAAVLWKTDEPATGNLLYRVSESGSTYIEINPDKLALSHNISLSGLTQGTEYEYGVFSADVYGNMSDTLRGSFTTKAYRDTIPPVLTRTPLAAAVFDSSARIVWETNEPTDSYVEYGLSSSYEYSVYDSTFMTIHSVFLPNLTPGSEYHFRIRVTDKSGNMLTGKDRTFTTQAIKDTTAPLVLEGPYASEITETGTKIIWKTDELSDSYVMLVSSTELSNDESKFQIFGNNDPVQEHKVSVTGLSAGNKYFYNIASKDGEGNAVILRGFSFTTLEEADVTPPSLIAIPIVSSLTDNSARITWKTDENATSEVLVAKDTTSLSAAEPFTAADRVKIHTMLLTGLEPETAYYYRIRSIDVNGNVFFGKVRVFRTLAAPDTTAPVIIEGPIAEGISTERAVIKWITDEPAVTNLYYGTGDNAFAYSAGSGDLAVKHSVTLTGLSPGTKYVYKIEPEDAFDNEGTAVTDSFTTQSEVVAVTLIIVNRPIVLNRTHNSASIKWTTNELSSSFIRFGKTSELSAVQGDAANDKEHNVILTNLEAATAYNFQAFSVYQNKDTVTSATGSFTTKSAPDTLAPVVLTGPIVIGRTQTQASIKWETNEPSNSSVEFGTDNSYGLSAGEADNVLTHVVRLTNLSAGTDYSYRFSSTDLSGNTFTSGNFTFKTLTEVDSKKPVILAGPVVSARSHNSATIQWQTDEPSTSFVRFGTDTTVKNTTGNAEYVKDHNIIVTGLTASTVYYYKIQSADISKNLHESSTANSLKTSAAPDTKPPVLVAGPEEIGKTDERVTIRWTTDESADGYVEFGESTVYDDVQGVEKYSKEHTVQLTNLKAGTVYNYRIRSTDIAGNKLESKNFTFTMQEARDLKPPTILTGPVVKDRTENSATIVWSTDEVCDGFIFYGKDTSSVEQIGDEKDTRAHIISVTNLESDMTYYARIRSEDPSGNKQYSKFIGFKTKAAEDRTPPRWTRRPNIINSTHNTATIQWDTDELADSFIQFGVDSTNLDLSLQNADKVQTHSLLLTNLESSTTYYYRVRSADFNNNSRDDIIRGFRTQAAPDTIAPRILRGPIAQNVTHNSATIQWETDERTSCFVMYGEDPENVVNKVGTADLAKGAKVSLTNLNANTRYYVAVISQDISRNEVNTLNNLYSFYTKSAPDILPPDIIAGPIIEGVKENSAIVKWKTNKPSNSIVEFGTDGVMYDAGPAVDEENVIDHKILLNNLISDTTYYLYISSTGINGYTIDTKAHPIMFRTKKEKDTKKPAIIKGPIVTNVNLTDDGTGETTASVTIEWVTDEPADGFVKFGMDENSLTVTEGTSELTTEHAITLTNLEQAARYYYVVTSTDIDENTNEKVRIINKFDTPRVADTQKPVIVKGPIVYSTDRSASFVWSTDELSDSFIFYGIADSIQAGGRYEKIGSAAPVTDHEITITNLDLGKEYIFIITSTDRSGNNVIFPEQYQGSLYKALDIARTNQPPGGTGRFKTKKTVDNQAPVIISSPKIINKTSTTVTIEWLTDEQSNSMIDYGTTQQYTLMKQSENNVTAHTMTLTNLQPATTYNYRVNSMDINRNGPSMSPNAAFTTESETDIIPPQIIAGPLVTSITDDQATIVWETDEPSDSYIEFTLDSTFGELDTLAAPPETKTLAEDVTSHSITLTNLTPDTLYYFRVASVDIEDNGPTFSADTSFRTAAAPDTAAPQIVDSVLVASVTDKSVTIKWTTDELSDSFVMFSKDSTFEKRNALRKGTNYYEYEFENNVGDIEDVIEHEMTLTNLEPNTDYVFTVGSVDKSDNTTHAPSLSLLKTSAAPDTTGPETPENFVVSAGDESAYLTWSPAADSAGDLSGYNIYRNTGSEWTAIASNITENYYYDNGLVNDSTYTYYVKSVDNVYPPNESEPSLQKSVSASPDSVPAAPTILSPANNSVVSNTLKPNINVLNSTSVRSPLTYTFAVAYDSSFLNLVLYKTGVTEGENLTIYTPEEDLENYTSYYARVRSNDGIFDSEWSELVTFSTDFTVDVQITVFTGKASGDAVSLEWETASETGNLGFNIYRGFSPTGTFEKINQSLIPSSEEMKYVFKDDEIEAGNTYYYVLESVDVYGLTERFEPLAVTALIPKQFTLHQNFPNPFNPVTTIKFDLPKSSPVVLKIYNVLGQEVRTVLQKDMMEAGFHHVTWDGTNNVGLKVASGIYLYHIRAGNYVKTKKMTFLK